MWKHIEHKKYKYKKKPKKKQKTEEEKQLELQKRLEKKELLKQKRREEMTKIAVKNKLSKKLKEKRKRREKKKRHIRYLIEEKIPRENTRRKNGDIHGKYYIMVTRDKKRIKGLGFFKWITSAYKKYNELIEQNQSVVFPKVYKSCRNSTLGKVEYEIILVKVIDGSVESNESVFKNDAGLVVTTITDDPNRIILERHPWKIERELIVYGYHPIYDRKTCPWVIDNIILKDLSYENTKQIFMWNQYLIIKTDYDFDFIQCKNSRETTLLYNVLFDKLSSSKYIFFTGVLNTMLVDSWRQKFKEKTGWSDIKLSRDENI